MSKVVEHDDYKEEKHGIFDQFKDFVENVGDKLEGAAADIKEGFKDIGEDIKEEFTPEAIEEAALKISAPILETVKDIADMTFTARIMSSIKKVKPDMTDEELVALQPLVAKLVDEKTDKLFAPYAAKLKEYNITFDDDTDPTNFSASEQAFAAALAEGKIDLDALKALSQDTAKETVEVVGVSEELEAHIDNAIDGKPVDLKELVQDIATEVVNIIPVSEEVKDNLEKAIDGNPGELVADALSDATGGKSDAVINAETIDAVVDGDLKTTDALDLVADQILATLEANAAAADLVVSDEVVVTGDVASDAAV